MPRAVKKITSPVVIETPHQKKTLPVIIVLAVLLLLVSGIAGYFYYQYQNAKPGVAEAKEMKQLVETLGAVIVLPEGEEPTLATVTDKDKLAGQPFFQKAENGDKVLIYTNSGRAILYRPSQKKIVDVTTVNVNQPQAETPAPAVPSVQTEQTPVVPGVIRLALYNGTTIAGVTNVKEKQLLGAFQNITVVSKDAAQKSDYEKTIVVDVSGKNAELATKIADNVGGVVETLPVGETVTSDTDIVVIFGQK